MAAFTKKSDLAPALDPEPVMERPSAERWDQAEQTDHFPGLLPGALEPPSGVWADQRSGIEMTTSSGPDFLDPGSFALSSHFSPRMEASSFHGGAVESASSDLHSAPSSVTGDSGGGAGGSGGGGGGSGGGGGGGGASS